MAINVGDALFVLSNQAIIDLNEYYSPDVIVKAAEILHDSPKHIVDEMVAHATATYSIPPPEQRGAAEFTLFAATGSTTVQASALLPMIELGALGSEVEDTGLGRINLPGGGKIEPVTASAISRLGLIYLPDRARALQGIRSSLRDGARFAAIVYSTADREARVLDQEQVVLAHVTRKVFDGQ